MTAFPEPSGATADVAQLFALYLDFYRDTVTRKARSLSGDRLRSSRLPSGWTPIELLAHLAFMERRWFVWGFLGERVDDPFGDDRDGRWHVDPATSLDDVVAMLHEVGRRTTRVLDEHRLDEAGVPGPRYGDDEPATLAWTCFHVLQEYARHAGHLDIAVELAGGDLGE
jgi:uncharacterized damage-inducible protein DinB